MRTITGSRNLATAVLLVLAMACAQSVPPDTPELRLEKALALAAMEIGDGGAYEDTLDLGASLAIDATHDALVLELGRTLTGEEIQQVEAVMRDALAEIVTADEWLQAAAGIYAAHFTPAELDAAMKFYSSPVGAKILGSQSTLDNAMADAVDVMVDERLEEFIELVDDGLTELFPEVEE